MQSRSLLSATCTVLLALSACQKSQPPAASTPEAAEAPAERGLVLKPEEVAKLGVETMPAAAAAFTPEGAGYGLVIGHETLAQNVAEIATAEAAARQSRAAVERVKRLSGTPGAFPAESQETAERQSAADAAALTLAQRRLSVTVGANPPWSAGGGEGTLSDLASGKLKLVRVTFPVGVLSGTTPRSLRFARLDADSPAHSWKSAKVWDAPADATVPGHSYFALLNAAEIDEGERLQVWAPVGAMELGVLVPAAATVISESKYWCYVERQPGHFERVEVDVSRPVAEGYQVTEGIAAGDPIVTNAAGLLLAREINPSTEAE
jgi:hypothetical protein